VHDGGRSRAALVALAFRLLATFDVPVRAIRFAHDAQRVDRRLGYQGSCASWPPDRGSRSSIGAPTN
jgi:hypothetical protein